MKITNPQKTKLILLIVMLLVLLITPTKTSANTFIIKQSGSNYVLNAYTGSATKVVIPNHVTEIAPYAFSMNSTSNYNTILEITEITIPNSVKVIGNEAFSGLDKLETIKIEEGANDLKIGALAFSLNPSIKTITIPGNVSEIYDGAFSYCGSLETVTIKKGVKSLGDNAFKNDKSLKTVYLPATLENIGENIFEKASTDFTIIAPQYKSTSDDETKASLLAKKLNSVTSTIKYSPTNYGIKVKEIIDGLEVTGTQTVGGTLIINKIDENDGTILEENVSVVEYEETIEIKEKINRGWRKEKITYTIDDENETELTSSILTMPAGNIELTLHLNEVKHQITAVAGSNGSISPSGTMELQEGKSKTFTITPDDEYMIEKIIINDIEQANKNSTFTIEDIDKDYTIEVTFKKLDYYNLTTNISNIVTTTIRRLGNKNTTISTGDNTNFLGWLITGIDPQNTRSFSFDMPGNDVEITYKYNEPTYNTSVVQVEPNLSGTTASVTVDLSSQIATATSDTIEIEVGKSGSQTSVAVTIPKSNLSGIESNEKIEQLKIETAVGNMLIPKEVIKKIRTSAAGTNITIKIEETDKNNLTEAQQQIVGNRPVYTFTIESNGVKITEFDQNLLITLPYTLNGGNPNNIIVCYIAKNGEVEEMRTIYKNNTVSFTTDHFSEYFIKNEVEGDNEQNTPDNNPSEPEENQPENNEPTNPGDNNQNNPEINNPPEQQKPTSSTGKKKKKKNKTETKIEEIIKEQQTEEIAKVEETKNEEITLNFTDVKEDGWYVDAIKYAVKNNIAKGTSDTTFSPNDPITRGQVITMLCRAYNIQEEFTGENFIDAGDTYYTGYIQALKNRKLINGTGDNKVSPKREITRQELIVIMHNIMKYTNNLIETKEEKIDQKQEQIIYLDENEIADWAKNSVLYFIGNKIIVGNDGKINPMGKATRAQMVQIIYNINKEK